MKVNFKKAKWVYNPHRLKFEMVQISLRKRLFQIFGFLSSSFVMAVIFFFVFESIVDSPEEKTLKQDKAYLKEQLKDMSNKVTQITEAMADLHNKDNQVYRATYEKEQITDEQFNAGTGGVDKYSSLLGFENSDAVIELTQRIDRLRSQVQIQSTSFDELIKSAGKKSEMLSCIPAIQPIANNDLRMIASGFGYRLDPIYKSVKMHSGIDFTASYGKEIHATGNGYIAEAGMDGGGYGIKVVINHGFGYQTLYGHMCKLNVRPGQKVQRGDVIGYVGSTGKSTGPHIHYEIIKNGQKINPVHFFYNDVTPGDYQKMVKIAERDGQSFD